jgi:hypothetical protein
MRVTELFDVLNLKMIPGNRDFYIRYSYISKPDAKNWRSQWRKRTGASKKKGGESYGRVKELF